MPVQRMHVTVICMHKKDSGRDLLYDMMSEKGYLQEVLHYAWQQCYHTTDDSLSSISAMTKIAPVLMRCKCSKKGYLYS